MALFNSTRVNPDEIYDDGLQILRGNLLRYDALRPRLSLAAITEYETLLSRLANLEHTEDAIKTLHAAQKAFGKKITSFLNLTEAKAILDDLREKNNRPVPAIVLEEVEELFAHEDLGVQIRDRAVETGDDELKRRDRDLRTVERLVAGLNLEKKYARIEELETQVKELKKQNGIWKEKSLNSEIDLLQAVANCATLEKQLSHRASQSIEEIQEIMTQLANANTEVQRYQSELRSTTDQKNELKEEMQRLREEVAKKDKEVSQTQNLLAEERIRLEDGRNQLAKVEES